MRRLMLFAVMAVLASVLASGAFAADAAKKHDRNWTPGQDDATVGTLGKRKGEAADPAWSKAAPPAPSRAAPVPQVEAGTAVVPNTLSATPSAPSLPAAPRPDAKAEGPATGMPAGPAPVPLPATPPTGFLPDHPYVAGLVAGLVGTGIGEMLYGGPMQGDQSAVVIGYAVRMGIVVLLVVLVLRVVWRMMGGGAEDGDDYARPRRREPSFRRREHEPPAINGRREPTFRRDGL